MLPAFVRLLEFIVLQSELDLVLVAVDGARAHLERPGVAAEVAVGWGADGAVFAPAQEEFAKVGAAALDVMGTFEDWGSTRVLA